MQKRAHSVPFVNLSNIFLFIRPISKRSVLLCMILSTIQHHLTFQNYLVILQKNTTIIQGPQRLAISVLNIREQNIRKILSQDWVQGSGIVFPSVFFLDLNINLNGIHRQLLNILMREYTYVDVHTLTDKFRKINHLQIHLFSFCFFACNFILFVICNN